MASDASLGGSVIRTCLIASDPAVSATMESAVTAAVKVAAVAAQNAACDADVEATLKRLPALLRGDSSGSHAALHHWAARDRENIESEAADSCSMHALAHEEAVTLDAHRRARAHLLLSRPILFRRPSAAAYPEHLRRPKHLVSSRLSPAAGSQSSGMAACTAARGSVAARSSDLAAALASRPYGRLCDYLHGEPLVSCNTGSEAAPHAGEAAAGQLQRRRAWGQAYAAAACSVATAPPAAPYGGVADMPLSAAAAAARSFLHAVTADALRRAPAAAAMLRAAR